MGSKTEVHEENTQTQDPWAPAQPFILDTMQNAKNLFNSDAGTQYFPGSTSTPMSWDTSYALDAMRNRAIGGSPLNNAAQDQMLNTINGDYFNPSNQHYQSAMTGGLDNNSGSLYQPFTQANTSPAAGYFSSLARSDNPHLDQTFANASKNISDAVNSNFAKAGRYGSGAHQGKLTGDLGTFANDLYGGAYQADQNRRLNAANSMQQSYDTDMARRISTIGNMSNIQNQNLDRRFNAANGLNQNFQAERDRQMRATQGAGQMAANDYADYDRLMQVGGVNQAQATQDLQAEIDRFNFFENMPYNKLSQYANLAFGYGGLGGTSTYVGDKTTTQGGIAPALGALGGFASSISGFTMPSFSIPS